MRRVAALRDGDLVLREDVKLGLAIAGAVVLSPGTTLPPVPPPCPRMSLLENAISPLSDGTISRSAAKGSSSALRVRSGMCGACVREMNAN